jgi:hypothetical protein
VSGECEGCRDWRKRDGKERKVRRRKKVRKEERRKKQERGKKVEQERAKQIDISTEWKRYTHLQEIKN